MNQELSDAVTALMQLLYGQSSHELSRNDLLALQSATFAPWIETSIDKLHKADLLIASFLDTSLKRSGPGLKAYLSNTYLPLALGRDFVLRASTPAIVHLVVSGKKKQQTGGAGFYCADVGNRLVTAAHNVVGREILKVESRDGKLLHSAPVAIQSHIEGLDLAVLDAVAPQGIPSLGIEWDKEEILPLMPLCVMGFPQIPQQAVAPIAYRSAEFVATGLDYYRRETYLITNVTSEGFSGGPAINRRGKVVGVVQGVPQSPESTDSADSPIADMQLDKTEAQEYDTDYSVLTPAYLIEELEPSLQKQQLVIMDAGL